MADKLINPVVVVGMGPGHRSYLIPLAIESIQQAQVLIGGRRHLEQFGELEVEKLQIGNNLEDIKSYILSNYNRKRIVVLASGDPGFHSILEYLTKHISRELFQVIPGISSIQLAFARLAIPWQGARLHSLHGKELDTLESYLNQELLALLVDGKNTPQRIASYYLAKGYANKQFIVCENLSYPEEKITYFTVDELAAYPTNISNCVVVVRANAEG